MNVEKIWQLGSEEMSAGDIRAFQIEVYLQNEGIPLDLTSSYASFVITPIGQPDCVSVVKSGEDVTLETIRDDKGDVTKGTITVYLRNEDTIELEGQHDMFLYLYDYRGEEHLIARGYLTIYSRPIIQSAMKSNGVPT